MSHRNKPCKGKAVLKIVVLWKIIIGFEFIKEKISEIIGENFDVNVRRNISCPDNH